MEARDKGGRRERGGGAGQREPALPSTRAALAEPAAATAGGPRHGGDLDAARARFPHAPEPWIDLSTGINPRPYPTSELPLDAWHRLPTASDLAALLSAAATRYGAATPAMITAAPGTQALIQLLPRLLPPSRVAILGPTYDEHEASWRRAGHDVAILDGLDSALASGARAIVAVNPNNPTGRLIARAEFAAAARELARRDGLLVVDEAFMDVLPAVTSLVPELPPSTVVLRSFGKTYGLAGLRLGFAVTHADLARRLTIDLGPWAVSGPAIAIGARALGDDAWLAATRTRLTADASRMDALLVAAGATIVGGTPLFRLADHDNAATLAARLGHAGVHVRIFDRFPRWLRLGLPATEPDWQRLSAALTA